MPLSATASSTHSRPSATLRTRKATSPSFVKKEGGDALDFLAKRHASSLSVLAPTDYAPERQWLLSRLFAPRDDAVEANGRGGQRVYRLTETPRGWRSGPIGIRRRR